jgi:hypothetical protein
MNLSRIRFLLYPIALYLLLINGIAAEKSSTVLNFPRVIDTDGEWTGIAIANYGFSTANLTFTAYKKDGSLFPVSAPGQNPVQRQLPAGQQLAAIVFQIFGAQLNSDECWMQVSSDQSQIAGFFLAFDPAVNTIDGTDVNDRTSSPLIFTEAETTEISIINPNELPANNVVLHYLNNLGQEQESFAPVSVSIPAKGRYQGMVTSIFPYAVSKEGYIKVISTTKLAGVGISTTPNYNKWALRAADGLAGAKKLFCPQFIIGGGYRSSITLVNLEETAAIVTLRWINDNGETIGHEGTLVIPAFGRTMIQDDSLFGTGIEASGYVQIESDRRLTGSVIFGDEGGWMIKTALPLVTEGQKEVIFSQVAQNKQYYTGVAIANPNTIDTNVTISIYDTNGTLKGSGARIIKAGARISKLLRELAPSLPDMNAGYFTLKSDQSIFSFAVFGTNGFTALSAVPASPMTVTALQ